ncbi:MAG TPA: dTMP kinase [Candidatus Acidoferrales bacterium]|nr:dTMP kinase [Candidatus Acidoferrales bacterium]
MFITFEGIEGSGKSTLMQRVERELRERGEDVLQTREPGGTPLGDEVRKIFLDPDQEIGPMAEVMLLCASRAQLCTEVIRPALRAGRTVLCDRFFDSTIAYQGYGRGMDVEELLQVCLTATSGLTPDLTFILDLPPEVSLKRVADRAAGGGHAVDRMERESLDFHRAVRDGYLDMARRWSRRFVVINVEQPIDASVHTILAAIDHARVGLRTTAS